MLVTGSLSADGTLQDGAPTYTVCGNPQARIEAAGPWAPGSVASLIGNPLRTGARLPDLTVIRLFDMNLEVT